MNIITAWFVTLTAATVVITIVMNQYLTAKWLEQTKEMRSLLRTWKERAEHSEDQLVVLKQRYRLLLSERGEE